MLTRKQVLFAKLEATYGVDPTPTGSDALVIGGLSVTPYDGDRVQREIDKVTLGIDEEYNVAPRTAVTFSVELAASGDKTVAPKWGKLLRACGFKETQDTGASQEKTVYTPVDSAFESITLYYEQDGQMQKVHGARGTVKFALTEKGLPKMEFTFTGSYQQPAAGSITPDFSGWQQPLPVTEANTPVWDVHGYSAIGSALNVDMAVNVVHGNRPGEEKFAITDRQATGDVTVKAPDLASKNFFAAVESHAGAVDIDAVNIQHGTAAGQIIELKMPHVQLNTITTTDLNGEVGYQLGMRVKPSDAGNDEITVISR